jgi:hypothetical protein
VSIASGRVVTFTRTMVRLYRERNISFIILFGTLTNVTLSGRQQSRNYGLTG